MFYAAEPSKGYSYAEGAHTITTKSVSHKGVLHVYNLEHAIRKRNVMKEPKHYTVSMYDLLLSAQLYTVAVLCINRIYVIFFKKKGEKRLEGQVTIIVSIVIQSQLEYINRK